MGNPDKPQRERPSFSRYLLLCMFVLVLCVVGFLTVNDYLFAKNNLEHEQFLLQVQTEQNAEQAIRSKDAIWSIYDASLNSRMEDGLNQVLAEYEQAGRDPSRMDLAKVRKSIGTDFDIYLIDESGVIAYTTYGPELGMDFKTLPSFYAYLTKIRNSDGFFPDRIVHELMGEGKFRKYAYMPTTDHRYVLELGMTGKTFGSVDHELFVNNSIASIVAINPYIERYRIFNSMGRKSEDNKLPEENVQKILAEVLRTRSNLEVSDPGHAITTRYLFIDLKDETYGSDPSRIVEITYSDDLIQDALNRLLLFHLLTGASAIFIGCAIAFFLSRRITRPIQQIVSDVDGIARGDLDLRIGPTDNREFAILETSINLMVDSLRSAIQAAKDEEIFKKEMIDQLPVGIFIKRADNGQYVFWNRTSEDLFNVPASSVLGKRDHEIFPLSVAAIIEKENQEICQNPGEARNKIVSCPHLGGRIIHLIIVPIFDSTGRIQYILGIAEDVSHQNINLKMDLLFSITRHDILDNLAVIMNHLERAQLKSSKDEMQKFFEKTLGSVESIKNQIASMRTLQNLGLISPKWHLVSLAFSDAVALLPKHSADIQTDLDGVEVYADPLFPRIFFILLENSFRSRGPGPLKIRISARITGETLHIMYQDTGRGIPNEEKEKIFEPGYDSGSLHGLFLVRELLDFTGISIHEIGLFGKGSIFDIQVPKDKFRKV
jgi:signal transduction histidine kinase